MNQTFDVILCCFFLGIRNLWPLQITSFTLNGNCPNSYNFPHALMPLLVQTKKLYKRGNCPIFSTHTSLLPPTPLSWIKKKRKMYTNRRWIDRAKLHLNTRMAFSLSSWFMVGIVFLLYFILDFSWTYITLHFT